MILILHSESQTIATTSLLLRSIYLHLDHFFPGSFHGVLSIKINLLREIRIKLPVHFGTNEQNKKFGSFA